MGLMRMICFPPFSECNIVLNLLSSLFYLPWIYGQNINDGSHVKEDLYLLYMSIGERTMF